MGEQGKSWAARKWALPAILILAGAIRIAVLIEHSRSPIFSYLYIDEAEYDEWARQAMQGHFFLPMVPNHGPGYPWFLGALYLLSGANLLAVRLAQIFLGLGSILWVHRISRDLFGAAAARVSALVFSLYWPLMVFEQRLLDVTLFLFLTLAFLSAIIRACRQPRLAPYVWTGLWLGLSAIVRPTSLLVLAGFLIWVLVTAAKKRRAAAALPALALLVSTVLIVGPVVLGSRAATGRWFLVQGEGGLNLYIGNNPEADGTPYARLGGAYDRITALPVTERGIYDFDEQDRFYAHKVVAFLGDDPKRFFLLQARKLALLVNYREVRATINPEFQRTLFPALRLPWPGFAVALALAAAGLPVLRLGRREQQIFLIYALIQAGAIAATVVSSRYRMPFTAAVLVLSGPGFGAMVSALRGPWPGEEAEKPGRWRRFLPFILFGCGLAAAYLPVGPHYTRAEDYNYLGNAWLEKGERAPAERWFREALAVEPNSADAMAGMSDVEKARGDLGAAVTWLQKAAAADPGNGEVHHRLGLLFWQQGKGPEAIRELALAVADRPQWLQGWSDLGLYEWKAGLHDRALAHLRQLLRQNPDFQELRDLIQNLERQAQPR